MAGELLGRSLPHHDLHAVVGDLRAAVAMRSVAAVTRSSRPVSTTAETLGGWPASDQPKTAS